MEHAATFAVGVTGGFWTAQGLRQPFFVIVPALAFDLGVLVPQAWGSVLIEASHKLPQNDSM